MDTFSIVFVCTGNRFRSPLAEAFVRRLTLGQPVTTSSFGTLELEGAPALPEAVELARYYGLDLSRHVSRWVTAASLADADLVLGFEAAHVRHAVVEADAGRARSFTMRELVRLLETVTPPEGTSVIERARKTVALAAASREGQAPRLSDDMADPLGSSWKVFVETAAEIRECSLRLVATLIGVTDAPGLPAVPIKPLRRPRSWRR